MDSLPDRGLVVFEGQEPSAVDSIPRQFAEVVIDPGVIATGHVDVHDQVLGVGGDAAIWAAVDGADNRLAGDEVTA